MRKCGGHARHRCTFVVGPVIVIGLSTVSSSVSAQSDTPAPATVLPPVTVIAPSPLAGTRTAKPKSTSVVVVRGSRTNRTPGSRAATAPVAGAAGPRVPAASDHDLSLIDRATPASSLWM
jgi:iron complex outermembrane receptor protein